MHFLGRHRIRVVFRGSDPVPGEHHQDLQPWFVVTNYIAGNWLLQCKNFSCIWTWTALSVCLFVCLSVCLFVCLSLCLFVSLSLCLFVSLSLCLLYSYKNMDKSSWRYWNIIIMLMSLSMSLLNFIDYRPFSMIYSLI